ncbi:hypothetical protein VTJ04DRAFT_3326 [Mycothermus thermophilus]|uniref:uncharacterized protein n=1 Tax=Humicola insolens TaxID=85995 RepID=UPI003741F403
MAECGAGNSSSHSPPLFCSLSLTSATPRFSSCPKYLPSTTSHPSIDQTEAVVALTVDFSALAPACCGTHTYTPPAEETAWWVSSAKKKKII